MKWYKESEEKHIDTIKITKKLNREREEKQRGMIWNNERYERPVSKEQRKQKNIKIIRNTEAWYDVEKEEMRKIEVWYRENKARKRERDREKTNTEALHYIYRKW